MGRTKRTYLSLDDAAHVAELAMVTEDRSDDEHDALVRLCEKLDRADGTRSFVREARATRVLTEGGASDC